MYQDTMVNLVKKFLGRKTSEKRIWGCDEIGSTCET